MADPAGHETDLYTNTNLALEPNGDGKIPSCGVTKHADEQQRTPS